MSAKSLSLHPVSSNRKILFVLLPFLLLLSLGLTGCSKRNPSNSEVMEYREGWGFGSMTRGKDAETRDAALKDLLSLRSAEKAEWFREGFEDGVEGREMRFEAPENPFVED